DAPKTPAPSAGGAWPVYQLDASHNAVIPRPGFAASWNYDAGAKINGGLAVVGDTVYFDTFAPSVGALDLNDGTVKWQVPIDNIVMSTPIVAESAVYVGTGSNHLMPDMRWGRAGGDRLVALDAADGHERWSYKTVGEDMPSPVYVGGALVFANGDQHAYAVEARSGKLLWRRAIVGVSTMASANVVGGNALVSTCTTRTPIGHTYAVAPRTGTVRWASPYGNCDSAPTVIEDRVFLSGVDIEPTAYGIGYRSTIAALDGTSGKLLWSYRTADLGIASPQVASSERAIAGTYAAGTYYQAIPTHDRMIAFDARSGRIKWSLKTLGPTKMSPVVRNGLVYFGDTAGCFYTVDAASGALKNLRTFDAPFSVSPPVIVGNTLIVAVGTKIRAMPLFGGKLRG
ncbi:MAG TPA: PQQ-binding-like beta-propeller repeat protein, partial [Candidatus Elarobacter sp.]